MFGSFLSILSVYVVPFLIKMIGIILLWVVGTKLIKFVRKLINTALEKGNADKGIITFIDSFVKFGLLGLLVIVILGMFGVEMSSVAAVIASAGVAVGLALQGSLSNLAGGVLILLLRPFNVGDYVIAGGLEGTVTEIQLFYTKLLTADNRSVVLPNGSLSNGNIVNVTAMDTRRIDIQVGISYSADLRVAKECLMEMLKNCSYVLQDKPCDVFVDSLADSSVILNVRLWVNTSDYWPARAYVMEHIKLALDAKDIEIPYNKLDVHVVQS